MDVILECKEVSKQFGDFTALNKVSFTVPKNTIFGIAGPNGAGKTTLFNVITSNPFPASAGKIIFSGEEIQNLAPYKIVHKGVLRTFQNPVLFKNFNYLKSVMVGSIYGNTPNLWQNLFKFKKNDIEKKSEYALDLVGLGGKKNNSMMHASQLDLKLLMFASAIAANPKLLLLDEPVSGLTDHEIEEIRDIIIKIHKDLKLTVFIIEHIMKFLMNISDNVLILNFGEVICQGMPKQVVNDDEVIKCYLGEEYQNIVTFSKE